eukprot:TRINITY_DN6788_c0_g1_i1.p1 TRINITY_DN6788_c0_g1~~TRINITY_DN6788_c0_g1_i1.p1  ORF type:complete len:320 (-),score=56.35 TRINITY_DN6788_c0_g1_i1:31-960(-)
MDKFTFSVPVTVEHQGWVTGDNIIMSNFVVTVEGTEIKDKAVIVGAHYDVQNSLSNCWRGSVDGYVVTSGADDNTSGTVGCFALLRRFTKNPPKQTTIVVCFDGEEPGAYIDGLAIGSHHFVKELQKNTRHTYTSAVIVDMIGGPPTVPEYGIVISASEQVDDGILGVNVNTALTGVCPITVASDGSQLNCLKLSDSVRFADLGIPTVLVANVAGYRTVPSFYHTERDTVRVLDWNTFLWALDIVEYLARNDLPTDNTKQHNRSRGRHVTPDPEKIEMIVSMGFTKEQATYALTSKNNVVEQAIEFLFQ